MDPSAQVNLPIQEGQQYIHASQPYPRMKFRLSWESIKHQWDENHGAIIWHISPSVSLSGDQGEL